MPVGLTGQQLVQSSILICPYACMHPYILVPTPQMCLHCEVHCKTFRVKPGQQPGDLTPSPTKRTTRCSIWPAFFCNSFLLSLSALWTFTDDFRNSGFFFLFFSGHTFCPEASFPTQHFCRITLNPRESPLNRCVNTSGRCDLFFWNK